MWCVYPEKAGLGVGIGLGGTDMLGVFDWVDMGEGVRESVLNRWNALFVGFGDSVIQSQNSRLYRLCILVYTWFKKHIDYQGLVLIPAKM